MEQIISSFATEVATGRIEIYNEFSLQHELGICLRNKLPTMKVQFERNVTFFRLRKTNFVKREIDISIFGRDQPKLEAAIELKFPRNGQHPEQMYSFCKDIAFVEQLKASGFRRCYVVIFADDHLFYEGNSDGIYGYFREGRVLSGRVQKPTGKRDTEIILRGAYRIGWRAVKGPLRYTIIEAQ